MSEMTKRLLAESFKKLLETKPYDSITVSDITEDCKMSRQTFYYHFKSMFDIVKWCYIEESMRDQRNVIGYCTWTDKINQIFQYTMNIRNIIYSVYNSRSRDILIEFFLSESRQRISDIIDLRSEGRVPQTERDFLANALSFSFSGILIKWMNEGMKDDPKLMVRRIEAIIGPNYIRSTIDKLAEFTADGTFNNA